MGVSGIGAVVARTPGGREVASSSLVSQTRVVVLCCVVLCWRARSSNRAWYPRPKCDIIGLCQGVAQLVARSVRDAEVVSSNLITLTIFCVCGIIMSGQTGASRAVRKGLRGCLFLYYKNSFVV